MQTNGQYQKKEDISLASAFSILGNKSGLTIFKNIYQKGPISHKQLGNDSDFKIFDGKSGHFTYYLNKILDSNLARRTNKGYLVTAYGKNFANLINGLSPNKLPVVKMETDVPSYYMLISVMEEGILYNIQEINKLVASNYNVMLTGSATWRFLKLFEKYNIVKRKHAGGDWFVEKKPSLSLAQELWNFGNGSKKK